MPERCPLLCEDGVRSKWAKLRIFAAELLYFAGVGRVGEPILAIEPPFIADDIPVILGENHGEIASKPFQNLFSRWFVRLTNSVASQE